MATPAGEPGESFERWQATTITQLTYAINLILTLSVAALGFQVSLLLGKEFTQRTALRAAAETRWLIELPRANRPNRGHALG